MTGVSSGGTTFLLSPLGTPENPEGARGQVQVRRSCRISPPHLQNIHMATPHSWVEAWVGEDILASLASATTGDFGRV